MSTNEINHADTKGQVKVCKRKPAILKKMRTSATRTYKEIISTFLENSCKIMGEKGYTQGLFSLYTLLTRESNGLCHRKKLKAT